ncbi:hypothetical protein HDU67_006045, partial [Dinochytrium kinnereticum]
MGEEDILINASGPTPAEPKAEAPEDGILPPSVEQIDESSCAMPSDVPAENEVEMKEEPVDHQMEEAASVADTEIAAGDETREKTPEVTPETPTDQLLT